MKPKQYILRVTPTKQSVGQAWETEPKTLRELRDYLEELNKNPNRGYDWGQRVTRKKVIDYATHMFAREGCTVKVIEIVPNGKLTASYDNIGNFLCVDIESDTLDIYISIPFDYDMSTYIPELDWEEPEVDAEGNLINSDKVYDAWFDKMRKHVINVFNNTKVNIDGDEFVVHLLDLWKENDECMVFTCYLRKIG